MELSVITAGKSQAEQIECASEVFGCPFNESLIHQVVTAYMAAGRAGTHAQKTRSEVRGGGIKPFRQKGSGRARAGTIRSPLWRKGGVVFAAKPRDYSQKVNKKMYRGAIRSIFSELIRQDRLCVVNDFALDTGKTKDMLSSLKALNINEKDVLVVLEAVEQNVYRASRNIPGVDVRDVAALDPVCLVGAKKVLISVPALKQIEEMFK